VCKVTRYATAVSVMRYFGPLISAGTTTKPPMKFPFRLASRLYPLPGTFPLRALLSIRREAKKNSVLCRRTYRAGNSNPSRVEAARKLAESNGTPRRARLRGAPKTEVAPTRPILGKRALSLRRAISTCNLPIGQLTVNATIIRSRANNNTALPGSPFNRGTLCGTCHTKSKSNAVAVADESSRRT